MNDPIDTKTLRSLVEAANMIGEAPNAKKGVRYFWDVIPSRRGQIQTTYHAQVAGAASGYGGAADGIELTLDRSDMSWMLSKGKKILLSGRGKPYPTVEAALDILGGGAWRPNDPKHRTNSI